MIFSKSCQGFLLIEAMSALMVITIGMFMLMTAQAKIIQTYHDINAYKQALHKAQQFFEQCYETGSLPSHHAYDDEQYHVLWKQKGNEITYERMLFQLVEVQVLWQSIHQEEQKITVIGGVLVYS